MTVIDICNLGLSAAKAKLIASLDDDSAEGRAAKTWYAPIRDKVLGDRIWSFAKGQFVLNPLAAAPLFGWERQFQLPAEVVRVHRVVDVDGVQVEWDLQGRVILSDALALYVTAVKKEEDTSLYSPGFCVAVGLRLGSIFAIPFAGSRQLRDDLWKEYEVELKDAAGVDGSQGRSEVARSTHFSDRRL